MNVVVYYLWLELLSLICFQRGSRLHYLRYLSCSLLQFLHCWVRVPHGCEIPFSLGLSCCCSPNFSFLLLHFCLGCACHYVQTLDLVKQIQDFRKDSTTKGMGSWQRWRSPLPICAKKVLQLRRTLKTQRLMSRAHKTLIIWINFSLRNLSKQGAPSWVWIMIFWQKLCALRNMCVALHSFSQWINTYAEAS